MPEIPIFIQISHLLVEREESLLLQNPEGKNGTATVFAKCNCIQTVLNLGVGDSSTSSVMDYSSLLASPQKNEVREKHLWDVPTCQPILLERVLPRYPISRGRTLETHIPRQWGWTKILSQPMASTMPRDQSQGTGAGAIGVCDPGHKVGRCREQSPCPPAGCWVGAKQVWTAGGIKALFEYDFEESSWPICGSHTVEPGSHDLIIIYQEYLIRKRRRRVVSS